MICWGQYGRVFTRTIAEGMFEGCEGGGTEQCNENIQMWLQIVCGIDSNCSEWMDGSHAHV